MMLISRRFVRMLALQHLYAFQMNQEAYDSYIAKQLREYLGHIPEIPDAEREPMVKQAWELLSAKEHAKPMTSTPVPAEVVEAIAAMRSHYERLCAQDTQALRQGLTDALFKVSHASLRLLSWLVVWYQKANRDLARAAVCPAWLSRLAQQHTLGYLAESTTFAQLLAQAAMHRDQDEEEVASWYRKAKQNVQLSDLLADLAEEKFLTQVISKGMLGHEYMVDKLREFDLNFDVHTALIKRQLVYLLSDAADDVLDKRLRSIHTFEEERIAQDFYIRLVGQVQTHQTTFVQLIAQYARRWYTGRLVRIDRVLMQLALCEIMYMPDIPTSVSINEYVDLAHKYSTPQSGRFINGVLDAVVRELTTADSRHTLQQDKS